MKKKKRAKSYKSPRTPGKPPQSIQQVLEDGSRKNCLEILSEGTTIQNTVELHRNTVGFFDVAVERGKKEGDPIPACKNGCFYCCYNLVVVQAQEALTIADYIKQELEPEAVNEIKAKVADLDNVTRGLNPDERFEVLRPCPLLVDGECSVYPIRPLSCRSMNATDAGPCKAALEHPDKIFKVDALAYPFELASGIGTGNMLALAEHGLDFRSLELTAALRIALEDPEAHDKWRKGEAVFGTAAVVYSKSPKRPGPQMKVIRP